VIDHTVVELLYLEGKVERWVRFGRDVEERIIDRRRRVFSFAPGSILAFVRRASNGHGTVVSRIDILRAVGAGEPFSTVPFVTPGGEILLRISGWPNVQRVLQAIDAIEAAGIDAAEVCPDYWRHLSNRTIAGEASRPYGRDQHRAWLLRRKRDA